MASYEESTPTVAAKPGLTLIASLCGSGTCPAIYRTDRGTLVVQGRAIAAGSAGINLSEGELLVEIPEQLLAEAAEAGLVTRVAEMGP
ncbi:MAG TPA: hypothetical protein VGP57_00120 [Actinoplanes sp.]|jgi:hypothetical protein|nr:hypothetical protein [Actinoplanes sp.]